jgi:hypothetical protein
MSKIIYRGELTPQQAEEYGFTFALCKFCNGDYLVVQQYVNDVICEGCGKWQGDE